MVVVVSVVQQVVFLLVSVVVSVDFTTEVDVTGITVLNVIVSVVVFVVVRSFSEVRVRTLVESTVDVLLVR